MDPDDFLNFIKKMLEQGFKPRLDSGGNPFVSMSVIDNDNMSGMREAQIPFIDVIEDNGDYVVIADLSGADEKDIVCKIVEDEKKLKYLIISTSDSLAAKYYVNIPLENEKVKITNKSFRNGIFEIILKK